MEVLPLDPSDRLDHVRVCRSYTLGHWIRGVCYGSELLLPCSSTMASRARSMSLKQTEGGRYWAYADFPVYARANTNLEAKGEATRLSSSKPRKRGRHVIGVEGTENRLELAYLT